MPRKIDVNKDVVEVRIRSDRKVLWVNTADGCICRISGIEKLLVEDESMLRQ